MLIQFAGSAYTDTLDRPSAAAGAVAQSGHLDALVALEQIGSRHTFTRNKEIYADGDAVDCWFKVIAGTVRICKFLADGRRHVAEFHFAGDCFGLDSLPERLFSAEAVTDVIVMRYPRRATERLIDDNPMLSRHLRDITLRDLTNAQMHMLTLSQMSASERVATFLLHLFDRKDAGRVLDLPMMRNDIADYLGLTMETVCRVMAGFKRDGLIDIPTPHRVELLDRDGLASVCEA